jgi:hypothetical protein
MDQKKNEEPVVPDADAVEYPGTMTKGDGTGK